MLHCPFLGSIGCPPGIAAAIGPRGASEVETTALDSPMTHADDKTETTFRTKMAATEFVALPVARPLLVGTFIGPDGCKALVRMASGDIRTMRAGDRIGQATVTSITDGRLRLTLRDHDHEITMPGRTT